MSIGKRGVAVPYLVVAAIAVFSLIVVSLLFTRAQTGHWIPDFIPSFNQTSEGKNELALVRYVILQDRVDYYDGATWRAFGDAGRELQGRVYEGERMRESLRLFYVDGKRVAPLPVELLDGYYARIRIVQPYPNGPYQRGDVLVDVWKHSSDDGPGTLELAYVVREIAGDVVLIEGGQDFLAKNVVAREAVRTRALIWRESVFDGAVRISYRDTGGREQEAFACMRRTTGSEDLVVDLSKEVDVDAKCGSSA